MKENWKIGNYPSVVVSDTKQKNTNFSSPPNPVESEDTEIEYYGGYLVCESIGNENNAKLIAAAPEMYEIIKSLENDDNHIPLSIWNRIKEIKQENFLNEEVNNPNLDSLDRGVRLLNILLNK